MYFLCKLPQLLNFFSEIRLACDLHMHVGYALVFCLGSYLANPSAASASFSAGVTGMHRAIPSVCMGAGIQALTLKCSFH